MADTGFRPPTVTVSEVDGSPRRSSIQELVFPNGSVTISGNKATIVFAGTAGIDAVYLKLDASNDPLTGELVITPSSGTNALKANKDITLKSGQKLIFDGA